MEKSVNLTFLNGSVDFAPFLYEAVVYVPDRDRDLLMDVELALYGQPAPMTGLSVEDLHLYLNDVDLTGIARKTLADLLDANKPGVVSDYRRGLDSWLSLADNLQEIYPGHYGVTNQERKLAAGLVEKLGREPAINSLNQLGDPRSGWAGSLHVFNFLYRFIRIPSLSLRDLINIYNQQSGRSPVDLHSSDPLVLLFSCGPSRFHAPSWNPANPTPKGKLHYSLRFIYSNPLVDQLAEINRKLSTTGPIHGRITQLGKTLSAIAARMDTCEDAVGDHSTLQAIISDIKLIKKFLGIT